MPKFHIILGAACSLVLAHASAQQLQQQNPTATVQPAPAATSAPVPATELPAPIDPPITATAYPGGAADSSTAPAAPLVPAGAGIPVGAPEAEAHGAAVPAGGVTQLSATGGPNRSQLNDFQAEDVAQVLRLLARQAKINLIVSDKVESAQPPLRVTMRLENKTPLEAIKIIADSKNLIVDEKGDVYTIKTKEEKDAEPTESAFYTFSYAQAEKVSPLLAAQLLSKQSPQIDARTNTVFYREVKSNLDKIAMFLETIDRPTQQVMIEARLVEVTANPKQSYGLNWGGVVGGSSSPQTFRYGGSTIGTSTINLQTNPTTGAVTPVVVPSTLPGLPTSNGAFQPTDFLRVGQTGMSGLLRAAGGQLAILSAPQMSVTMRLLNEDSDAEFLANPRVVTANNMQAVIKITRNQPVPQLNFNEQTATAVFGGFQDKEYGNTLTVTPSINKDDFITMQVKPEISNRVGDQLFTFAGATVSSPVIDKRTLDSNVLIKSGDTLAIGGLLQDEVSKGRTKVPVLGDIPIIGYAFQERVNARTKRNLLVFVTPTIIKQGYGTGLEDQVSGLHHSGEEYADPNGWRNNAKGAIRLTPTSNRQNAADYPKPGTPVAPRKARAKYKAVTYEIAK